jgi:hypothetical protein
MSCGCGKKKAGFNPILPNATGMGGAAISLEPENWGPCFWQFLHTFTERVGQTTSPIICHSQATIFRWIVVNIPTILPCQACQAHAKEYIIAHPLPATLETLPGDALREQLRTWFFAFHTAVRQRLGQPVLVADLEACREMYESEPINDAFIRDLSVYVIYAVRAGWVKLEAWKRWVTQYNRLKLAVGGTVT